MLKNSKEMSKFSFVVTATEVSSGTKVSIGNHVGTVTSVEEVFTKPEDSNSGWQDSASQVKIAVKTAEGTISVFQPRSAYLRDTDTVELDRVLANMPASRLKSADISGKEWKLLTRAEKIAKMFTAVNSDQYDSAKAKYLVFKHGAKVRVELEAYTLPNGTIHVPERVKQVMDIIGRIPVTLGLCEVGETFDIGDLEGEKVGIKVVDGPKGVKVERIISVAEAMA